jgi:hypothetical protein
MVTLSDALPVAPFVRPEGSEFGEILSQLPPSVVDVVALHVSVDPGAPVFVIVTGWVTALPPAVTVEFHVFWLRLIVAIGSQRRI